MTLLAAGLRARLLDGFDDPSLPEVWHPLLHRSDSDVVFMTPEWQRAWWETFGRGRLLLILVERLDGEPVLLAPLFAEEGMVFPVGAGGSDYLDLVGDTGDPAALDAALDAARELTDDFTGFLFYHVPQASRTGSRLREAAARSGLVLADEGGMAVPRLSLEDPRSVAEAAGRKSLRRHESFFRREGAFEVFHDRATGEILPHLEAFFDQHVARWAETPSPSLFTEPSQRAFYERLTHAGGRAGWLRFTRVVWNGKPIAFHFGFSYAGSFMWYKPTFAPDLVRRSPGEVLLRNLILAAAGEGARTFDFGLGEEPFKMRFATTVARVDNWGLYAKEKLS